MPEARTALLALGAALALAAPSAGRSGHEPFAGAGAATSRSRSLLHNGDSLSVGQLYLRQALPGWRIRASVDVSRHASEGPGILRRYGRRLPRVIVVSLGTNDDPRAAGVFRRAIRQTTRIAGRRRCVVWSNIVRPPVAEARYGALKVLRRCR